MQSRLARQVAAFGQLASAAVAQGYRGLRLAADTSSLVTSEADLSTFTGYELLVDAMITRQPLLALCGYDQGATAPGAADALCFVHPLHHRPAAQTMAGVKVGTDISEGLFADVSGGWRLRGTLDLATARSLGAALAALPQDGDVHLYLDELRFCDAAATRALVRAAMQRHPAGRLVLHHAPPLLRLGWPGDNPGLHLTPS